MKLVHCVHTRETMPNQLVVGNHYWIDESTQYKDFDGDEYVAVYLDEFKENRVGNLLLNHFEEVHAYKVR